MIMAIGKTPQRGESDRFEPPHTQRSVLRARRGEGGGRAVMESGCLAERKEVNNECRAKFRWNESETSHSSFKFGGSTF